MRKICIVVTARPSYARIKTVMTAIKERSDTKLQLVVAASALLERYGSAIDYMIADGFEPDEVVYMVLEGENLVTTAKSTGLGIVELATVFDNLQPNVVISVADRYETIATTIAAAYSNIPLAHVQGGEVTGSIDEKVRHAVTKLSDLHFVANEDAAQRVIKMGEDPNKVFTTGCPSVDLAAHVLNTTTNNFNPFELLHKGVGEPFDPAGEYLGKGVDYKTEVVFSVETACDLWQPLVHYFYTNGYSVVRVSPLSTYHSRVQIGNDFSKTDPKDALIIASSAANGFFVMHNEDDSVIRSMRTLSITSDKLRKDLVKNKNRIVSFIKRYFPEFIKVLDPETLTARYLLKQHFLPQHYLSMDIEKETEVILSISRNQHGKETLLRLQQIAEETIGVWWTDG